MSAQNVLVLCATHRDRRELGKLGAGDDLRIHFHDYASLEIEQLAAWLPTQGEIGSPREELSRIISELGPGLNAVLSTDDYPGSLLAAMVAKRLALPGVSPIASIRCQHKYLGRLAQKRLVPDAVPWFALLDGRHTRPSGLEFPAFVKPVKSFFSIGGSRVDNPQQLDAAVARATLPLAFYRPFEELMGLYPEIGLAGIGAHSVMAESLLCGDQCTLEGYVRRGIAHTVGVIDSIFYPGTQSFQRFEYPSALPPQTIARLEQISSTLMQRLDYGDGFFNIEFMIDRNTGAAHIIEVNPRLASQFADLYEKVDGSNTYAMLLALALGKPPIRKNRAGLHQFAASCALRRFEDAYVRRIPSESAVERLQAKHPDMRIELLAPPGERLSESMQDGHSFRYAILNIGASNRGEMLRVLDACVAELEFDFVDDVAGSTRSIA